MNQPGIIRVTYFHEIESYKIYYYMTVRSHKNNCLHIFIYPYVPDISIKNINSLKLYKKTKKKDAMLQNLIQRSSYIYN
jgi:hypothetical protein